MSSASKDVTMRSSETPKPYCHTIKKGPCISRTDTGKIEILSTTISRKMEQETLLINLVTNEVCTLNITASRFWELLSSGSSLDEITQLLLDEFEVDPSQLQTEIDSILNQLQEQKFIKVNCQV